MSAPLASSSFKVRENTGQRCPSALAAVRVALAQPFADPVNVGGIPMRRAEARELERILTSKPARHSHDATASAARSLFPLADGGATQSPALSMAGRTAEASLSSTAGLRGASHRPVHAAVDAAARQEDHPNG
jgi:pectin methylesterase-like acyl-CoA thioesterase